MWAILVVGNLYTTWSLRIGIRTLPCGPSITFVTGQGRLCCSPCRVQTLYWFAKKKRRRKKAQQKSLQCLGPKTGYPMIFIFIAAWENTFNERLVDGQEYLLLSGMLLHLVGIWPYFLDFLTFQGRDNFLDHRPVLDLINSCDKIKERNGPLTNV